MHFALGKAYANYANIADPDKTFAHWLSGNALKRQQIDDDEAAMAAQFAQIEETFTLALIGAKSGHGDPSSIPTFVLGMPRSGTTLVEQILASHPWVDGAGELMLLSNLLRPAQGANGGAIPYPQYVAAFDGPAIRELRARYIAELSRLAPEATHVTDKMPGSFIFL